MKKKTVFLTKLAVLTTIFLLIISASASSSIGAEITREDKKEEPTLPPPNWPPFGGISQITPNPAEIGESIYFSAWAKDYENGTMRTSWDFGDGYKHWKNGTGFPLWHNIYHTYTEPGVYTTEFHIIDMGGKTATYYQNVTITNDAPNTPTTPTGPTSLDEYVSGIFETSATDPDGDQVQYRFDWDSQGSHDYSSWTTLGSSGHIDSMEHSWNFAGTYVIKAQARDAHGAESSWSSGLSITVNEEELDLYKLSSLKNDWNLVSIAINQEVDINNLIIKCGTYNYTWDEATSNQNPFNTKIIDPNIFGWNRTGQNYEFVDSLKPGEGYWVYSYFDVDIQIENVKVKRDTHVTDLLEGWSIFGIPVSYQVDKTDLIVNYDGVDYTWGQATTNNNPTGAKIVDPNIFGWDEIVQSYSFVDIIKSGKGYWIYSYQDCTIKI